MPYKDKEFHKKFQREWNKRKRREFKAFVVELRGGHCQICGYSRCTSALEFHHRDPKIKDFELSKLGRPRSALGQRKLNKYTIAHFDVVLKELDKCLLVCANCHREIHDKLIVESEAKWCGTGL